MILVIQAIWLVRYLGLFNNYSPSLRWIIVLVYSHKVISTESERKPLKSISLIDGWIHAWTRSGKQWMHKSSIFTASSNMANDSLNLFVSSFVSFSINGLKENAENIFKSLPNSENKSRAWFVSVNSPWMRKFSLSLLANAVTTIKVSVLYLQCSLPC